MIEFYELLKGLNEDVGEHVMVTCYAAPSDALVFSFRWIGDDSKIGDFRVRLSAELLAHQTPLEVRQTVYGMYRKGIVKQFFPKLDLTWKEEL